MNKTMLKLNKIHRYAHCRDAKYCVSTTTVKNALQGNGNNFGDFYRCLVKQNT